MFVNIKTNKKLKKNKGQLSTLYRQLTSIVNYQILNIFSIRLPKKKMDNKCLIKQRKINSY